VRPRARPPLDPPLGVAEWPIARERLLHPSHSALIILDMQNKFLAPGSATRATGVVEAVQRLLASARAADVLRVFVRVRPLDPQVRRTGGYMMKIASIASMPGAPGAQTDATGPEGDEFAPEIAPRPGEVVVEKVRFSAFFATWLDHLLRNHGIRTVVLTGVASYGAVVATAFDAAWRDYYVVVPPSCVAGDREAMHAAALTLIGEPSLIDEAAIRAVWG
jgi:nicotinamidase-related amidase